MKTPPLPLNQADRLEAPYRYQILNTDPEKTFDDLTNLAAYICSTPISLVSLVDASRQWFKSKVGLNATGTPRELAFCAHAIVQPHQMMIVPNALEDQRFATNPLVTSDPNIRFYVGTPLVTPNGFVLGTLCAMVKNHHLAKSISDASWSQFREWVEYFGRVFGVGTIAVPPDYTSQNCSSYGVMVKKSLSARTHTCKCGTTLDRDHNAALNILRIGLSAMRHTGTNNASGENDLCVRESAPQHKSTRRKRKPKQ